MEIRHSFLAHAGESDHESGVMPLILDPSEENKQIIYRRFAGFSLKDDDSNIENYEVLFNAVLDHIDEQIASLKNVVNREIDNLDIEEIYNNAKKPENDDLIPFTVNSIK